MIERSISRRAGLTRSQGMTRLAAVTVGVGVVSVLGAAGVAVVLPGSTRHAAAASVGTSGTSTGSSPAATPSAGSSESGPSGSPAATSGGS